MSTRGGRGSTGWASAECMTCLPTGTDSLGHYRRPRRREEGLCLGLANSCILSPTQVEESSTSQVVKETTLPSPPNPLSWGGEGSQTTRDCQREASRERQRPEVVCSGR